MRKLDSPECVEAVADAIHDSIDFDNWEAVAAAAITAMLETMKMSPAEAYEFAKAQTGGAYDATAMGYEICLRDFGLINTVADGT